MDPGLSKQALGTYGAHPSMAKSSSNASMILLNHHSATGSQTPANAQMGNPSFSSASLRKTAQQKIYDQQRKLHHK